MGKEECARGGRAGQDPGDQALGGLDRAIEPVASDRRLQAAGFSWNGLSVVGPVSVLKWKLEPNEFSREITVEEWSLPDDSDLIELSTKVEPAKAVKLGAAFRNYILDRGLDPNGDHQTKTRTALRLFTGAG
jgi:hypothetical protein